MNFNLQLPPRLDGAGTGAATVQALVDGGLAAGCMQLQLNVLDPKVLAEARDHPGKFPRLLVRVSGYSAYFDDLSPEMQQEIIVRFARP
ncbi:MAG: autonomous glycyl radical cofactor GrcA [Deltaproteobacteria bacterium]|nr:autonomous glycyl radical cofactor GrcA [Deltaproteobacteria bacterium]